MGGKLINARYRCDLLLFVPTGCTPQRMFRPVKGMVRVWFLEVIAHGFAHTRSRNRVSSSIQSLVFTKGRLRWVDADPLYRKRDAFSMIKSPQIGLSGQVCFNCEASELAGYGCYYRNSVHQLNYFKTIYEKANRDRFGTHSSWQQYNCSQNVRCTINRHANECRLVHGTGCGC